MSESQDDDNVFSSLAGTLSQAAGTIGRTIGRTAASAGVLLSDADLRRKGRNYFVQEASKGIKDIQQKVGNAAGNLGRTIQHGADTLQRGIIDGPRHVQGALELVKTRLHEAKYASQLEVHRNLPVDVQIAEKLFEDAPQDIRMRLWVVLTQLSEDKHKIGLTRPQTEDIDLIDLNTDNDDTSGYGSWVAGPSDGSKEDWELVENPSIVEMVDGLSTSFVISFESLMEEMSTIEWPLNEEISPESNYGTLIQITIGQDEVDDIIRRDLHRTFPELPHFNYEAKCAALFNILKAYSLHDLEVGYCQGMSFVAGVLLIYLPEHWAFRMLCVLMDEKKANLRKFYLPGLVPLKAELWKLEWLLEKHLCILAKHFRDNGVVSVLFASQWFLTCFACPFNESFAARVLDMIMCQQSTTPLIKVALAILVELGETLLQENNFEDILIHIKVKPLSWSASTIRKVLHASLSLPVSDEDIRMAETHYHELHREHSFGVQDDADNGETLSNIQREESIRHEQNFLDATDEDLALMLSMDLLIDVDSSECKPDETVTPKE